MHKQGSCICDSTLAENCILTLSKKGQFYSNTFEDFDHSEIKSLASLPKSHYIRFFDQNNSSVAKLDTQ